MEKSQIRVRPKFLVGLLVCFLIVPWIVSSLLPTGGGPTRARAILTRRHIGEISSAISNQAAVHRIESAFRLNSSNGFSAVFLDFKTNAINFGSDGVNLNGELLDFWRTPYRIEITIQTNYVIRSAGKNQILGDKDDIVLESVKAEPAKP
jgi:hypothetical protein